MVISKRAERVLERIKAGRFYEVYGDRARSSLDELEAAGLIRKGGRFVTIGAYYVPSSGYVPLQMEAYEGEYGYSEAIVRQAAPDLLEALKASNDKLRSVVFEGDNHPLVAANNAAIAKAEGRL